MRPDMLSKPYGNLAGMVSRQRREERGRILSEKISLKFSSVLRKHVGELFCSAARAPAFRLVAPLAFRTKRCIAARMQGAVLTVLAATLCALPPLGRATAKSTDIFANYRMKIGDRHISAPQPLFLHAQLMSLCIPLRYRTTTKPPPNSRQ